jgi:CRP-like cAMP-binding protein
VAIERILNDAVQHACSDVFRACFVDKTRKHASSALGALLVLGDYAISAHVGNTRLYLVRGGKSLRLTRDHTYYEEMLAQLPKGSQVNPAFKKRLTRAIGDSESVPLALSSIPLVPQDLLVLCSNGLSDFLGVEGGAAIATACSAGAGDAGGIAAKLIELALKNKSDDNITALVVQLAADPLAATQGPLPIHRDAHKQLELLRGLKVLSGIRDDDRALLKVQGLLTVRQAGPGDIVVQQGSPSDELFILISGKTEVLAGGKHVAHRGPGDVIGEMGFFDRRLRSATIKAIEPSEFLSIQRWEFDALVQQDWRMGYKILEAVVVAMAIKLEESSG